MKRELAATIFSALLAGTALAGPIESSQLPPPAQNSTLDDAKLRGLIENALNENKQTPAAQTPAAKGPLAQTIRHEDWDSFSSAELWLEGIPETDGISLDALARNVQRYPGYRAVDSQSPSVPTAYTWNRGSWKANVGTNVTTATSPTTVIPVEAYAGTITPYGGAGAIDGRVEYDVSAWQFYGGTKRALVANPDGTLAANNNINGGTYYNLPPSLLGGKVGTGFEVNPIGDAKTRLEYRQMFGNTEGFLAAERSTPFQHATPDITPVNGLKAGINRKF
jgi:hypothetical protein